MKFLRILFTALTLMIVFTSATQCSGTKETTEIRKVLTAKEASIQTGQVYFQKWIAGQENGGSGINIFFPNLINKNHYSLQQVYFRNMIGKMQSGKASYFAKLTYNNKDMMMSNEPNGEYGNTIPNHSEAFPFTLKDNECVISYLDNEAIKYIKLSNIVEKQGEYYPSAPPKHNKN